MNDRFVPLKVVAEVDAHLANYLRISSYPTTVLAGPDLKILQRIIGYKDPGEFYECLQRVLTAVTSPEGLQKMRGTNAVEVLPSHIDSPISSPEGKAIPDEKQKDKKLVLDVSLKHRAESERQLQNLLLNHKVAYWHLYEAVHGNLKANGTLELPGPLALPPGPVEVTVRAVPTAQGEDILTLLARIRLQQQASGHKSRTKDEIDADINMMREEWEERQLGIERVQEKGDTER